MSQAENLDAQDDNADPDNNGSELNDGEREKLIEQLMQLLSSGDSEECSICLENLQDPVITKYVKLSKTPLSFNPYCSCADRAVPLWLLCLYSDEAPFYLW